MPPTHLFKVQDEGPWHRRIGISPTFHEADLVLRPDRVQLNNVVMLADEIEWIRWKIESLTVNYVQARTTATLELGSRERSLCFSLTDRFTSTARTSTFQQIWALVYRFFGVGLLRAMQDILLSSGSFSIGAVRFQEDGVQLPRRRFLIAGDLELVPWEDLRCDGSHAGEIRVLSFTDRGLVAVENLWTTRNACLIDSLVHNVQTTLLRRDGRF